MRDHSRLFPSLRFWGKCILYSTQSFRHKILLVNFGKSWSPEETAKIVRLFAKCPYGEDIEQRVRRNHSKYGARPLPFIDYKKLEVKSIIIISRLICSATDTGTDSDVSFASTMWKKHAQSYTVTTQWVRTYRNQDVSIRQLARPLARTRLLPPLTHSLALHYSLR